MLGSNLVESLEQDLPLRVEAKALPKFHALPNRTDD